MNSDFEIETVSFSSSDSCLLPPREGNVMTIRCTIFSLRCHLSFSSNALRLKRTKHVLDLMVRFVNSCFVFSKLWLRFSAQKPDHCFHTVWVDLVTPIFRRLMLFRLCILATLIKRSLATPWCFVAWRLKQSFEAYTQNCKNRHRLTKAFCWMILFCSHRVAKGKRVHVGQSSHPMHYHI